MKTNLLKNKKYAVNINDRYTINNKKIIDSQQITNITNQ